MSIKSLFDDKYKQNIQMRNELNCAAYTTSIEIESFIRNINVHTLTYRETGCILS